MAPDELETRVGYSEFNLVKYQQQRSRLEHTVTIDETWISFNRPPEKDQAREWRTAGEKVTSVAVPDRFGPKVMLILAMDIKGIFYYELLAENENVNSARYLEFLTNLMDVWRGNRQHRVWLLDDNARPHRSAEITGWIKQSKIERWLQPPYSPDLSPCDYGCFHALKRAIGGVPHATTAALREAIDQEITYGNANCKYTAVERLPERWRRCMENEGEYL